MYRLVLWLTLLFNCLQIDFGDSNEIDFGSIDVSSTAIDFGDGDVTGEIDWGNIDSAGPVDIVSIIIQYIILLAY